MRSLLLLFAEAPHRWVGGAGLAGDGSDACQMALSSGIKIVTDGDHAPMASINNAICTVNYGHDGGISETGRDIGQLSRTELAWTELANVLVLMRMLGEVAPIGFDRLFNVVEYRSNRPWNWRQVDLSGLGRLFQPTSRKCHLYFYTSSAISRAFG